MHTRRIHQKNRWKSKLTSVAETSYNTELTAVRSQKLGQKQNIVDVTNTYNDVPVTGIIMNTLPYVLMIALCGVRLVVPGKTMNSRVQE